MRRITTIASAALIVVALSPVHAASAQPGSTTSTVTAAQAQPMVVPLTRKASGTTTVRGRKGQTLTVTPVRGLARTGQAVRVTGNRFSELVGVYVSLCVQPRPGRKPSPCGGGNNMSGKSKASVWVSSNPPPYAQRLTKPYKRGGKFSVTITVGPRIGSIDCRRVKCAVVARADHTRANDRSWDVIVPVTFR